MKIWKNTLVWLGLAVLMGCATTTPPARTIPSMPPEFGAYIDLSQQKCSYIEGDFANQGERYNRNRGFTSDGLLTEDVLSRRTSDGRRAVGVSIRSDAGVGMLEARLIGHSGPKISLGVACSSGWHSFRFERSGTYLGEGAEVEQYKQLVYVRQDSKGRLIAWVLTDSKIRTLSAEESETSAENWYRFEPISP